jgi:beta-barrel assembly-enhancing protease
MPRTEASLLQKLVVIVVTALTAAAPIGAMAQSSPTANDLPDIGSPASSVLTLEDEYHIGLQVMRQLRDQGQIVDDPEATEYLQQVGSRLVVQATGDTQQKFRFFFVRDSGINAFALPGGFIGVNYGLMLATRNEAQLAGVLAHEIAHVTQRHIARRVRAQGRQSIATVATILAAILIGAATGSSDAAMAGVSAAQGAAMQQQINFTRHNEYEADRIGIGFLAAAGFDPYAMPDFFETLGRRTATYNNNRNAIPEILQTHPVSTNRIAESRARAAQYADTTTSTANRPEATSYSLTRERLRVIASGPETNIRRYYADRREAQSQTMGERYGEAIASFQSGNGAVALDTLTELSRENPGVPMLQSALGQALVASGAIKEGLDVFRRALALSPRNIPLTIRYAEALLKADQAKSAHMVLLDLFNNVAPTPEQIRFTALAASSAGDAGDAAYYMSEYHLATGDPMLSLNQLEMALAAPNLTAVQRSRFQARLDEVREAVDRDRSRREAAERRQRDREGGGQSRQSGQG